MIKYTNVYNIPLPLQVWMLADDYDYAQEEKYISATTLLKPVKQIILNRRSKDINTTVDISTLISRSLGTGIHSSIEHAWLNHYKDAFKALNYSDTVINRIKLNPDPNTLSKEDIPIYLEQRAVKEINGWKIGGKFDLVIEGQVNDYKSTKVFSYISGSNSDNYIKQGSIYRWLNPHIITEDTIKINYVFTDWQKVKSLGDPKYPKCPLTFKEYPLMSLDEIERFIVNKLELLDKYWNEPEDKIPDCTDEELWRSATVYKYFSDASKTNGKSQKNFESREEANAHLMNKGKGVVLAFPGSPKRCLYCNGFPICNQRKKYFNDLGELL